MIPGTIAEKLARDDARFPSVTTVLGIIHDEGFQWVKMNRAADLDALADLGRRCHSVMDMVVNGATDKHISAAVAGVEDQSAPHADALLKTIEWARANVEKVIMTEKQVISKKWGYHGHPDFIGMVKGYAGPMTIDWKFTTVLKNSYAYQLAAYAHGAQETMGGELPGRLLVKSGKDGKFKIYPLRAANHWTRFQYALELYRGEKEKIF